MKGETYAALGIEESMSFYMGHRNEYRLICF